MSLGKKEAIGGTKLYKCLYAIYALYKREERLMLNPPSVPNITRVKKICITSHIDGGSFCSIFYHFQICFKKVITS